MNIKPFWITAAFDGGQEGLGEEELISIACHFYNGYVAPVRAATNGVYKNRIIGEVVRAKTIIEDGITRLCVLIEVNNKWFELTPSIYNLDTELIYPHVEFERAKEGELYYESFLPIIMTGISLTAKNACETEPLDPLNKHMVKS